MSTPLFVLDRNRYVRKAALAIAYDNGKIHRHHTEDEFLEKVEARLRDLTHYDVSAMDNALKYLTVTDFEDLCVGEVSDRQKVVDYLDVRYRSIKVGRADHFGKELLSLLNDIFELPNE